MRPWLSALGPRAICSLIITLSTPSSSAMTAQSTRVRRWRGESMVQFSLRIKVTLRDMSREPFLEISLRCRVGGNLKGCDPTGIVKVGVGLLYPTHFHWQTFNA